MDKDTQLEAVELEKASPEVLTELREMMSAYSRAFNKKMFYMPTAECLEKMKKYARAPDFDTCPKCKRERLFVEMSSCSMGYAYKAVCGWDGKGCGYTEELENGY
jgi:hypothetical protein